MFTCKSTYVTSIPPDPGIQQCEEKSLARNHGNNLCHWVNGYASNQTKTISRDWVLLEMLSVYAMVGNLLFYHHIAYMYVVPPILWSMPWIVHQGAFLQFDIMRCETSLTSAFLSEVCHNLQPLQGEHLRYKCTNGEAGAQLDVDAQNLWRKDHQTAFFDINPFAQSYANLSLSKCYRKHELDKKREYEERIHEIEHGSFSPSFGILNSWRYGPNSDHSVQENCIINCWQTSRTIFYYTFLVAMQIKFSISYHVPLRNQVISSTLTRPIYTIGLCRDESPLKFLFYFVLYEFILFIYNLLYRYSYNYSDNTFKLKKVK